MESKENAFDPEVSRVLRELISANLSSIWNFNEASSRCLDSELRCAYNLWRAAREQFANDIHQLLLICDPGYKEESLSLEMILGKTGEAKTRFQDDQLLVESTRDAEEALHLTYRKFIDEGSTLPKNLRAQLSSQSLSILESWSQLKKWADSRRYLRID